MRRKKQPTRRQKALRALAILVFMVLYIVIPGRFYFLPSQAIQEAERIGHIGPTQVIYEFPGAEGHTLRGNDKGLMVSTLRSMVPYTDGWEAERRSYLDCSKPAPFHVGFSSCSFGAEWYGRIDDPAAASLRLELYEWGELLGSFALDKEDWIEKDGHLYFALEIDKHTWAQFMASYAYLLDSEGNVLATWEREWDSTWINLNMGQYQ